MPKKKTCDVLVIGSGSAGFSAVEAAVAQKAKVIVVEKGKLGGECPNFACVPSKAILKAAKVKRLAEKAKRHGVRVGTPSFHMPSVKQYRQSVVDAITGGGEHGDRYMSIMKKLGATVVHGEAIFVDDRTVEVNGQQISAKAIVIATGTVDFVPPIEGLDQVKFLGWKEAIQLKHHPKTMAIIGGGPVGCEIATFFSAFDTRVILIQGAPFILHREDPELSQLSQEVMKAHGVEIITSAQVKNIKKTTGGVVGITVDSPAGQTIHAVEKIVIATGKRSNVNHLNLEAAGVRLDDRGVLKTNAQQRTNVKHIFGAGDVDGGMQFTHTAHHEGSVAGHNAALAAKKKRTQPRKSDERVVPRATFVDPEVASVGMTVQQVKDAHKKALVGRYPVSALGRAVTENDRAGLIKIVAHPKTRKVLGGHVMCARAGEVVHEIALAIHLNATIDKLANMIHAFPTYSEGVAAAAASAKLE